MAMGSVTVVRISSIGSSLIELQLDHVEGEFEWRYPDVDPMDYEAPREE
jgi:hypothetical protein